ncbi:glycosyltransferase family 4 protein [Psychromonas hadalis]|uniref:glycosyltransferase family 4 protein n=1 Tax=Psychromonas hadalis TaxID=211669 RepID=UPI001B7FD50C|nr:glycosyltransferase family 4 protein [Psychromonas hadalis]
MRSTNEYKIYAYKKACELAITALVRARELLTLLGTKYADYLLLNLLIIILTGMLLEGEVMKSAKIWILLDSRQAGGIESHVVQLAQGLLSQQVNVCVVFLQKYGPHPIYQQLQVLGIHYQILNGKLSSLYQQLKKQRPTVLHTHGYKAGILGRVAARLANVTVISTYHAGEISQGKLAFYDCLDRYSAFMAHHVFAVSPKIAARLPGNTQVFDNFIDNRQLAMSSGKQIAFVGRVSTEKGPDYFLHIAQMLPAQQFHLYGDGPLLTQLQQHTPTNLHLHGQQDDMSKLWPKIGLLVMPSRYEGLPMAALEAMARGIPVAAFNVGALHKLINCDINGWLVEPDNVQILTEKINLWLTFSQPQKSALQVAAQQKINRHFSSRVAIPKLLTLYQQSISPPSGDKDNKKNCSHL